MNDRLGIRGRTERVAAGDQLTAKRAVIVDFAVEDHPDGPVLVGHRLVARCAIDDREPAMAEGSVMVADPPFAVRPTVAKRVGHRGKSRANTGIQRSVERGSAADATHGYSRIDVTSAKRWPARPPTGGVSAGRRCPAAPGVARLRGPKSSPAAT